MVGFISWLRGFVRIRVSGLSVERFMNLCGHRNILLWDVVRKEEYWEMCISIKAFRLLRPIVRKTGTKVVITERCGLPFFIHKMGVRKIFVAGLILCFVFWYSSANFIWKIKISGNLKITEEQLRDYLEESQVSIGTSKKRIDIEQLEKNIRMEFAEITWTSIKIDGTVLCLDIKENDGIKVLNDEEDGAYNLISHVEGEIYSMVVRAGIPKVKQGDLVSADTILVEGKIPVYNDDGTVREYLYRKADADILIKHTIEYAYSIPNTHIEKIYTGRNRGYSFLCIGEKEFSLHNAKPFCMYDCVKQETTPSLLKDLHLPISWGRFTYREYMNTECLYSKEEAKALLEENLLHFLAGLEEKGVQIIEKDVTIVNNTDKYEIMGNIVVAEPATCFVEINRAEDNIMGSQ